MISADIREKPEARAASIAASPSPIRWSRPSATRSRAASDCTPMEIRSIPASRQAARLSAVQSTGLASMVTSRGAPPKAVFTAAAASARQSAGHSEGVPPPK